LNQWHHAARSSEREDIRLAAAIAEELKRGEEQGEDACGQAAHGKDQREPAKVGVGALMTRDAAEAGEDERGGDDSCAEDK